MEKEITKLTRIEIIYELAKYAHPTWYHTLLRWRTDPLRQLLAYYKGIVTTLTYDGESL